jgi:hypothetical protein
MADPGVEQVIAGSWSRRRVGQRESRWKPLMDPRTPSRSRLRKEQKICRTRGGRRPGPTVWEAGHWSLMIKLQVRPSGLLREDEHGRGQALNPGIWTALCCVHAAIQFSPAAQLGTVPAPAASVAFFFSADASYARFHPILRKILSLPCAESRFQGSQETKSKRRPANLTRSGTDGSMPGAGSAVPRPIIICEGCFFGCPPHE